MRRTKNAIVLACGLVTVLGLSFAASARAEQPATQPAGPTTQDSYRTASYGLGYQMGLQLKSAPVALETEEIQRGLSDAMAGKPTEVSREKLEAAMMAIETQLQAKREEEVLKLAAPNIEAGLAFCGENAKKPGVVTLPSGVQIETLTAGTGASPQLTDVVKIHYTGTLIDGTKFDSSREPDPGSPAGTEPKPIEMRLNRFVRGWAEGVGQMKVGGKSKLVIPSSLAYGNEGSPPVIPPGATLVFEVELLDIVAPATMPAEPQVVPASPAAAPTTTP